MKLIQCNGSNTRLHKYIVKTILITIYLTGTVKVSTKRQPELENVSFQHVNDRYLLKQLYKQTSLAVKPSSVTVCTLNGHRFQQCFICASGLLCVWFICWFQCYRSHLLTYFRTYLLFSLLIYFLTIYFFKNRLVLFSVKDATKPGFIFFVFISCRSIFCYGCIFCFIVLYVIFQY